MALRLPVCASERAGVACTWEALSTTPGVPDGLVPLRPLDLGSGRIVGSETEAPNLFANQ
jgi:hypothetical protein